MMTTVNVHEAKTQFSKLLNAVEKGETVIIAKAGRPVAKLVPVDMPAPPQRLGFLKDAGWVVPDDFDTLMQDEIIAMFEGEESE